MKNTNAEKRKAKPEAGAGAVPLSGLVPLGIFLVSAVLACGILFWTRPLGFEQREFTVGEPALRTYFSPLAFTFTDETKTEALRREKLRGVLPVYRTDAASNKKMLERVEKFFKALSEARKNRWRNTETRLKELPFTVPEKTLNELSGQSEIDLVKAQVVTLMGYYFSKGVLGQEERRKLSESGTASVLFVNEETRQETTERADRLFTVEAALNEAPQRLDPQIAKKKALKNAALQVFAAALSGDIVYDETRSGELRKKTSASVPPVEVTVKKEELIVQRGMLVTDEIKQRLDQVHRKLATQKFRAQVLTGAFLVFLLYFLSFLFLSVFEPKLFRSASKLLLFHAVILISLFLSKAVTVFPDISLYLMPTALAALLLTLLLYSRAGILGGIIMTVLAGFLSGFRADIVLGTLLASLAATFLAYRVRKRTHFLKIGFGIGTAYFLVIAGFQIAQGAPWSDAAELGAFGILNSVLSVAVTFLVLPVLEAFFDVVTDVSLLELSDLNHPLIKRMMVEAPGTYHHSLVMSALAENACERIGAHALLARVGCYFHDIGKIGKPEFFSENQGFLYENRHDGLSPKESFEIIVDHVAEGIRLARQHKLKKDIVNFIAEHQGTGVIYYFYKKALDQAAPDGHVRADDFRYPGPKPQSRETAVVLLADSVEAASRSLKDPTPDAIQQLVRKIINDKFIDGQLDECELTLQDLHKIQAGFVRNLTAIFHTRMKYPPVERPESAPDLFGANQFSKFRVKE